MPWATRDDDGWHLTILVYALKPRSEGSLGLRSADPRDPPVIDHGFLRDESDASVIADGVDDRQAAGGGGGRAGRGASRCRRRTSVTSSARTCAASSTRWRPARSARSSTVEAAVLGLEGLHVGDASIIPTMPRANTNLSVAAVAERLAELLV